MPRRAWVGVCVAVGGLAGCATSLPAQGPAPESRPAVTGFPARSVGFELTPNSHGTLGIQSAENGTNEETTRIIVKGSVGARAGVYHAVAACIAENIDELGISIITLTPGTAMGTPIERVRRYPGIEYAEADLRANAVVVPNDPGYGQQWAYTPIQGPAAWDVSTSSDSVRIAILDTGIDQDHEDLKTKIASNVNFTTSRTVDDKYGHGTHVAGVAAAATNNAKGVAGTGFNARLMNVKVLNDQGSGQYSWIIKGIVHAADNGARVINLSLGGYGFSQALQDAVNYASGKGILVVAAAGNDNTSNKLWPAACPNALAVAASSQADTKASFSNWGDWVDVAAPGESIYSTMPNHGNRIGPKHYYKLSGTSMATPFVAGEAALLAAIATDSLRTRIESTCDAIAGTGTYFASGRINLYRAVTAPVGP